MKYKQSYNEKILKKKSRKKFHNKRKKKFFLEVDKKVSKK